MKLLDEIHACQGKLNYEGLHVFVQKLCNRINNDYHQGTDVQKPSVIGIIISVIEQFERIKNKPVIWKAVTLVAILMAISGWTMTTNVDLSEIHRLDEAVVGLNFMMVITNVMGSVFDVLMIVLLTTVIHRLIALATLSNVSFRKLFFMNTFVLIITALGGVLNSIVLFYGIDIETSATSLSSIINSEEAVSNLWNSVQVFSIWGSIITLFGLRIVAGFSKKLS